MRKLHVTNQFETADELARAYTGSKHMAALRYANKVARRPRRFKPRRVNGRLRKKRRS